MTFRTKKYDTAVIGGGLTGLTAAVYLAKAGKKVLVFEKESELGGLSQTKALNGALFNLGPRAMYEGGAALRILRELDCLPNGGYASKGSMIGILRGEIVQVPTQLSVEENEEWRSLMGNLSQIDTAAIRSVSLQEWVETNLRHQRVRLLFYAMCRQWSYCDDKALISSGFVIRQGQLAGQGVRYVEGSWQRVIDLLHNQAIHMGATFATGYKAEKISLKDDNVHAIVLADGTSIAVSTAIIASGPDEACRLVDNSEQMSLGQWNATSYPLYGACLDLALRHVPCPERVFALGLDEPLYFSNHSDAIHLSEDDAHVLHVMKYKDSVYKNEARADEKRLCELLDLLQPGWEKEVVARRFSPNIRIAHDARTIHHQGAGPAPSPTVPEARGLYVAGDWVGQEGRLADAAMSSAKLAAEAIIQNA